MAITKEEIRTMMEEIQRDMRDYPRPVMEQHLRAAGWESSSDGDIWLPPLGTVPYRPYPRYRAWKTMRAMKGL